MPPVDSPLILVHDLGTTCDKAVLFGAGGRVIASCESGYPTHSTPDGGFQQDPADWLRAVASASRCLMEQTGARASDIAGISLSGHMMGVAALDGQGRALRPALLHSDIRSAAQVRQIGLRMDPQRIHRITGNPLDVHYPLSKMAWLRDTEPDVYRRCSKVVQSKDYVSMWLCGCPPVTDFSDASLYGCFDFSRMTWSSDVCEAAGIRMSLLPDVVCAGTPLGRLSETAARETGLVAGIPVFCGLGDGASAAVGAGAWPEGTVYICLGSTAWCSATTATPAVDTDGRLFTLAITPERFAIMGTVQCAGTSWDWAVRSLADGDFAAAESLAAAAPAGCTGLLFLPYLTGERSPVWDGDARGVWLGLSVSHGRAEMLRSVLEGVSLALAGIRADIRRVAGLQPQRMTLIGGGARTRLWRAILAAACGVPMVCPQTTSEATARGAFAVAAVGAGVLSSMADLPALPECETGTVDESMARTYSLAAPLFGRLHPALRSAFGELAALRERLPQQEEGTYASV